MKEQNTNQTSTRQVIEIHRRAIGDMQKMCPYLLPSTALYAIVSGIVPYVTVFFSARILNELAGQRRPGGAVALGDFIGSGGRRAGAAERGAAAGEKRAAGFVL